MRSAGSRWRRGCGTLLRVDPDIVLVGEIRDTASATIAARAALAGRLVMATVHGRDPATAIAAMHYLSVPYYVLGGALRTCHCPGHLIRKACPACFRCRPLEPHERQLFEQANVPAPDEVFDAVGCPECFGHGYRGRTGVFQIVSIDDEFGGWLAQGRRPEEIRERLAAIGSRTIVADALQKAAAGVTSMSEVLRFYGQKVDLDPLSRLMRSTNETSSFPNWRKPSRSCPHWTTRSLSVVTDHSNVRRF